MQRRALLLLSASLWIAPLGFLPLAANAAPAAPAATTATNPQELVHDKTQQILKLIEQHRTVYAHQPSKLYAMVQKQVLPYFDFRLMSRWVLGKYWRTASPQQKTQFTKAFQALLVRTYATALLSYTGQKIHYEPFRGNLKGKTAAVRTVIRQTNGGPDIPVDYSFYKEAGGWKVYDVTIDRVSLVTNYRTTYASKIQQQGLNGLIASMNRVTGQGS